MTHTIRMLTIEDIDGVEAVVRSRQTFLAGTSLDQDAIVRSFYERLLMGEPIMGLFEEDGLDVFFGWKAMGLVPRADDAHRYDQGARISSLWSRRKAGGRAKLPTGQDINGGLLRNAALQAIDAQKLYTRWYLMPAAWVNTPYHSNPLNAEDQAKRVDCVAGHVAPGGTPTGPYAGFIKRRLLGAVSVLEPMVAYAITLKDEHRAA